MPREDLRRWTRGGIKRSRKTLGHENMKEITAEDDLLLVYGPTYLKVIFQNTSKIEVN